MSNTPNPTPVSPLRLIQVMWVLLAALLTGTMILAAFHLLHMISVSSSHTYPGTLKPNGDVTVIELPAGVPLKKVLVGAGETVRAGQTLALVDTDILTARLRQISRTIEAHSVLRSCLLDNSQIEAGDNLQTPKRPTRVQDDAETAVLIQAALADCALEAQALVLKTDRIQQALGVLQQQSELIDQKLSLVLSQSSSSDEGQVSNFARAGLSLSLKRTELEQQIQTLSQEQQALKIDAKRGELHRVQQLSKETSDLLFQQEILMAHLKNPRLQAPQSGIIKRIRPILAGQFFKRNQNIIEIRKADEALFIVEMELPAQDENFPFPGTDVQVHLLGFAGNGPDLTGKVSQFIRSEVGETAGKYIAQITLSEDSQNFISDPVNGIALGGQTTASAIRVKQPPQTLWHKGSHLWQSLTRNVFSVL